MIPSPVNHVSRVGPSGELIVKDEFEGHSSHSAADGGHGMQTIQHTAAPGAPPDTFNSPALLPPADSASSASTSAFTSMAAGPPSTSFRIPLLPLLFFLVVLCFIFARLCQTFPAHGPEGAVSLPASLIRTATSSTIRPCLTRASTVSH